MKIVCFSDWQGYLGGDELLKGLRRFKGVDFLIFAGDGFLNLINPDMIRERTQYVSMYMKRLNIRPPMYILEYLVKFPRIAFLYVEGNDDPNIYLNHFGAIRLSCKIFGCRGYNFIGIPASSGIIKGINTITENKIKGILSKAKKLKNLIIVSHMPPYGILDRIPRGTSIGSTSIREFLENNHSNISLIICGHAHGYGGKFIKFKNTLIINCAMRIVCIEISKGLHIRELMLTNLVPSTNL